jgi:hypothetical protein
MPDPAVARGAFRNPRRLLERKSALSRIWSYGFARLLFFREGRLGGIDMLQRRNVPTVDNEPAKSGLVSSLRVRPFYGLAISTPVGSSMPFDRVA